jgi:hypothetical protein
MYDGDTKELDGALTFAARWSAGIEKWAPSVPWFCGEIRAKWLERLASVLEVLALRLRSAAHEERQREERSAAARTCVYGGCQ